MAMAMTRKRQSKRKEFRLVRVSCDAGGRINHWLLTDVYETGCRPVEILDQ